MIKRICQMGIIMSTTLPCFSQQNKKPVQPTSVQLYIKNLDTDTVTFFSSWISKDTLHLPQNKLDKFEVKPSTSTPTFAIKSHKGSFGGPLLREGTQLAPGEWVLLLMWNKKDAAYRTFIRKKEESDNVEN